MVLNKLYWDIFGTDIFNHVNLYSEDYYYAFSSNRKTIDKSARPVSTRCVTTLRFSLITLDGVIDHYTLQTSVQSKSVHWQMC